eukprot:Anaeramoba_flamelloidesa1089836_39.p1 GENE.a1089836_39~~a1089836_39.p1  ORF type:complete len:181 (-),score=39.22 a1089836_39:124-666(-)
MLLSQSFLKRSPYPSHFAKCLTIKNFVNCTRTKFMSTNAKQENSQSLIFNYFKNPPRRNFFSTTKRNPKPNSLQLTPKTIKKDQEDRKLYITFTCEKCDERSSHAMSHIAYTTGVVIIQCPGCDNWHLIADNLGYFEDGRKGINIEDIMREKGEEVRRVTLDQFSFAPNEKENTKENSKK